MESDSSVSDSLESVREWLRNTVNGAVWKSHEHDQESTEYSSYQGSCSEDCSASEVDEQDDIVEHRQRQKNNQYCNQIAQDRSHEAANQDRDKPFYVPRKPHFFEHDLRILDEEEEEDSTKKNVKKEDQDCWAHDLYDSELQKPKSKQEIIDSYGYDIRTEGSFSTVHNYRRRRFNHQKDHCVSGFRSKSKFDEYNVNKPSSQQEDYHLSSKFDYDKNMKVQKQPIVKFKERAEDEKTLYTSIVKSEPKYTYKNQNYCPTTIKLERDENDVEKSTSVIPSSNSNVKIKDRTSSGTLTDKYHGKTVQTKTGVDNLNLSNNVIPVKNRVLSSYARGRGRTRDFASVYEQETNHKSAVAVPSWKNSAVNESIHKNYYRNVQSFVSSNVNPGLLKMRAPLNAEENLTSPTRLLTVDAKIPIGNAIVANCNITSLPNDFRYYNDYMYDINNGENFVFPEPPDVSVAHLTPCIPQHHYYFTNNHPHQNFNQVYDPPMRWGYYTQSSCYQGSTSGIAYLKQHSVSSWPNSPQIGHMNHMVTSHQQHDLNPYYTLHNEGVRCLSPSSGLSLRFQNLNFLD